MKLKLIELNEINLKIYEKDICELENKIQKKQENNEMLSLQLEKLTYERNIIKELYLIPNIIKNELNRIDLKLAYILYKYIQEILHFNIYDIYDFKIIDLSERCIKFQLNDKMYRYNYLTKKQLKIIKYS